MENIHFGTKNVMCVKIIVNVFFGLQYKIQMVEINTSSYEKKIRKMRDKLFYFAN